MVRPEGRQSQWTAADVWQASDEDHRNRCNGGPYRCPRAVRLVRIAGCREHALKNRAGDQHVGRRIGSLGRRVPRFDGGDNTPGNLVWCCLWCNTWPNERVIGATDYGGLFPGTD